MVGAGSVVQLVLWWIVDGTEDPLPIYHVGTLLMVGVIVLWLVRVLHWLSLLSIF